MTTELYYVSFSGSLLRFPLETMVLNVENGYIFSWALHRLNVFSLILLCVLTGSLPYLVIGSPVTFYFQ